MIRALPILFVLILAGVARAEDELAPETRVRVWTNPPDAYGYVGEAMDLWITIRYEPAFLEKYGVALFRRELDLPLQIRVPWLDGLAGTHRLASTDPDHGRGLRIALNDAIVSHVPMEEDQDEGEPERRTLDLEVRLAATSPGQLRIPGAVVRFAYATKFEEDFVGGKVALDRKDVVVEGQPLTIEVKPLPEDGRPTGFSGAVGRFKLDAEADESTFAEDGLVRLTLRFEGSGNFETWPAPHVVLEGFHVYGVREKKARNRRTITYEIAPISSDAIEIPAIRFAFFNPAVREYKVVHTHPIPLRVRVSEDAVPEPPDGAAAPVGETEPEPDVGRRVRICLGLWLVGALLAVYLRRRGDRARALARAPVVEVPDDSARLERVEGATAALQSAAEGAASLDAFVEFLAAHLDVTTAAVIAPDLAVRLRAAGAPETLADRSAAILEQGIAARYGGPVAAAPGLDDALILALQEAFASD